MVFSHLSPLTSYLLISSFLLVSCGLRKQAATETETMTAAGPVFDADSAYLFCQQQCDFGPRTMNSKAHDLCEQWIINKFKGYGMTVVPQKCDLKGYDGTILHSTNIIASYKPDLTDASCSALTGTAVPGRTTTPTRPIGRSP